MHIRAISQEMPQPSITKICLKITCLKFHSNFPGAIEYQSLIWAWISHLYSYSHIYQGHEQSWVCCIFSIRFMMGGEHGKLKYGPPEGHSPVCESLMPKDVLLIEPCFAFGDLPRGIIVGPRENAKNVAFVPHPVDTSHVRITLSIDL